MTGEQIIFLLVALFTLGSGFRVVTTGNLIHAAFWLVSTLFGVAVVFAILNAGFLAVVQVVVYIGAIAILFIFAVMLTRKDMRDHGPQVNKNWWIGALLSVLTFGVHEGKGLEVQPIRGLLSRPEMNIFSKMIRQINWIALI